MARFRLDLQGAAYRKVLGYIFSRWVHQPQRLAAMFGLFMAATVLDVLTPLYAGRLVEAVSTGGAAALDEALWAFATLIALGLGAVIARQFGFMSLIRFTLVLMADVAQSAFARVQRLSTDWHASTFAGSTVRKVTRGMWGIDVLNDTFIIFLFPSLVMLVGTALMLGLIWPAMGVLIAIGSLVYIALTVALSVGYVSPAASLANMWDTRMGGALADAITCNAVVKGFGAEDREEARLAHVVGKWRARTERTWRRGTINGGIQGATLIVLRTAIVGLAILFWQQGLAAAGDIALVLTSFFVLQGYLRDIGQHVRNLQRAVNDMEELVDVELTPPGVADRPTARPAAITAGAIAYEHVDFRYGRHETPLYSDLSVTIPAGQRVGLVGASGSGKTTFVKLIQRLYDVTGGRIAIDGIDIRDVTQASLRRQIAIVQQDPILFHRSLAENIAYGRPGASRAEIVAAAKLASAHGFIEALPRGYETLVGERGVKLSGGERQRVAIARAFLADAPILILDEATSSLDSESEVLIQEAMERLMVGRTTLVIAHRLSTVRALDRLLVFEKGRIIEEGTHAALVRSEGGLYRRLFERQALELTRGLQLA
jgi:ATP-binding cassette subfamily B protein